MFSWQHQTAIYKKELFDDKKVGYGTSRNGQDVTFLLIINKKARNIIFDDGAVYYYAQRSGSQTAVLTERQCRFVLDSLSEKIDFLLSGNMDRFDYWYLSQRFSVFVSCLCYAIFVDSLSEEQAAELADALSQQIIRLPDQNQVKAGSVEIRILMDHQKLIPARNLHSKEFRYDRVRRWVDFLSEHPKIKNIRIWTRFDFALVEVIFPYDRFSYKFIFSGKQFLAFIREQIGRLTGSQRSLMLLYSFPALKRALKKVVRLIYRKIRPKGN